MYLPGTSKNALSYCMIIINFFGAISPKVMEGGRDCGISQCKLLKFELVKCKIFLERLLKLFTRSYGHTNNVIHKSDCTLDKLIVSAYHQN